MKNLTKSVRNKITYIHWCCQHVMTKYIFAPFRKRGITIKYKKIHKLKNTAHGEACVLIGTAPSLRPYDIEVIKQTDITTFSCNSIVKSMEELDFNPDYYGIIDRGVFKKLKTEINNSKLNNIICASFIHGLHKGNIYKIPMSQLADIRYGKKGKSFTEFSDDPSAICYDGYTVIYMLLQVAVYMGYKTIYILGVDCNYEKGKNNHFNNALGSNTGDFSSAGLRMIEAFKVAKAYADKHGIRIYNIANGGMLEVFERKKIEELLK